MSFIFSLWTVLALVIFIGICVWAWWPGRRAEMKQHARMALDDDRTPPDA